MVNICILKAHKRLIFASKYYVCDTEAELPAIGLAEGDLAYTKDTKRMFVASSTTTWKYLAG